MSYPHSSTEHSNTEAGSRDNSETTSRSPPEHSNGHDNTGNASPGSITLNKRPTHEERHDITDSENYNRYSSSSTSRPGSGGSFADEEEDQYDYEYGHEHAHDNRQDHGYEEEEKSVLGGLRNTRRIASAQSSVSSFPGSVIVNPHARKHYQQPQYNMNDGTLRRMPMGMGNGGSPKKSGRTYKFAPQVRERDSPFRHPSSVCAMQMDDEDDEELEFMRRGGGFPGQHGLGSETRSPRMSGMSLNSVGTPPSATRSYQRQSLHAKSPSQSQQVKKEYPLVLLHCTLLQPSLPLSVPERLGKPSPELLKDILPDTYWKRWKLLEDKLGGLSILRDRGVLISHPQEAYDLLEERLLESLELVKPRLAYGHFLGPSEDGHEEKGTHVEDDGSSCASDDERSGVREKCLDCGQKVVKNPESGERKWEIRVYAANGLMKSGAWSAAWREMEKVDVEVGVWLPIEVKRELDRRIIEEDALKVEAEARLTAEEDLNKEKELYNDPTTYLTQEQIDGLDDSTEIPPFVEKEQHQPPPSYKEPQPQPETTYSSRKTDDINLQEAFFNYVRVLLRDRQLSLAVVFLVLLALVTPSPYSVIPGEPAANEPFIYTTTVIAEAPTVSPSGIQATLSQNPVDPVHSISSLASEILAVTTSSVHEPRVDPTTSIAENPSFSSSSPSSQSIQTRSASSVSEATATETAETTAESETSVATEAESSEGTGTNEVTEETEANESSDTTGTTGTTGDIDTAEEADTLETSIASVSTDNAVDTPSTEYEIQEDDPQTQLPENVDE